MGDVEDPHPRGRSDPEELLVTMKRWLETLESHRMDLTGFEEDPQSDVMCGGFGTVVCGKLHDGRVVAVKKLRADGYRERRIRIGVALVRELLVWATLKHDNILPLIGFFVSYTGDGSPEVASFVSPWMKHGSIDRYIQRVEPDRFRRLELAIDVALGLEYLHTRNPPVCHGDIKAPNVLVNDQERAMLCDFGLAKAEEDVPSGLTTTGFNERGSTRYLSPELVTELTPRRTLQSDIWAWGCLLFEIFTGKLPHYSATVQGHIILRLWQKTLPANLDDEDVPFGLRSLLEHCWAADASKRPTMGVSVKTLKATRPVLSRTPVLGTPKLVVHVDDVIEDGEEGGAEGSAVSTFFSMADTTSMSPPQVESPVTMLSKRERRRAKTMGERPHSAHSILDVDELAAIPEGLAVSPRRRHTASLRQPSSSPRALSLGIPSDSEDGSSISANSAVSAPAEEFSDSQPVSRSKKRSPRSSVPGPSRPTHMLARSSSSPVRRATAEEEDWQEQSGSTHRPTKGRTMSMGSVDSRTSGTSKRSQAFIPEFDFKSVRNIHMSEQPLCIRFSPRGDLIAVALSSSIMVYNTKNGQRRRKLKDCTSLHLRFTAEGDNIMWTHGAEILISDLGIDGDRQNIGSHDSDISCLDVSSDNSSVVCASMDGIVRVWSINHSGRKRRTLRISKKLGEAAQQVVSVAISATGLLVATSSNDNMLRLWTPSNETMIRALSGHSGSIRTLAFASNETALVSGGADRRLKYWDLTQVASFAKASVQAQGLGGKGKASATIFSGKIPARTFAGHKTGITSVMTTVTRIFSASEDGEVRFADGVSGSSHSVGAVGDKSLIDMAIPEGQPDALVAGVGSKSLSMWSFKFGA